MSLLGIGGFLGTLYLAAVAQVGLAPHLAVLGFAPDFLLIAMTCLALMLGGGAALTSGFFAGLLQGALSGANLSSYVISRTIASWPLAGLRSSEVHVGPGFAGAACFAATIGAQLLLMFIAPPPTLWGFVLSTLGAGVYNGLLAIPIYAILARIAGARAV